MSNQQQQMMRQAQAMMKKMTAAQEELAEQETTVTVGGGTVSVSITGDGMVTAIEIKPEVVDADDVEMLQDLILAGVNEAITAAKELEGEIMGGIAGGLGLPPGLL